MTSLELPAELDQQVSDITEWLGGADPSRLYQPPAEGEWSVMELMAHVTDVLRYWPGVLSGLAATPGQRFGRRLEDSVRVGYVADHRNDSVGQMLAAITEAGANASRTLGGIPEAGWQATGVHEKWGTITVADIAQRVLLRHLPDHLAQAQATAAAAGPPVAARKG